MPSNIEKLANDEKEEKGDGVLELGGPPEQTQDSGYTWKCKIIKRIDLERERKRSASKRQETNNKTSNKNNNNNNKKKKQKKYSILDDVPLEDPSDKRQLVNKSKRGNSKQEKSGELIFIKENLQNHSQFEQLFDLNYHRKIFGQIWILFLRSKLPLELFKSALDCLDVKVIPFMEQPFAVLDFVKSAFDYGGTASILALKSLFLLMTKYGL